MPYAPGPYAPGPYAPGPYPSDPYAGPRQTPSDGRTESGEAPDQEPDLTAPTEDDAAAAEMASNGSLSGATGTPSAAQSAAPNAIGDFFGAPGDTVLLSFPTGFVQLQQHVQGPLLAVPSPGLSSSDPARLRAVIDPLQNPGEVFIGSAASTAVIQINGQNVLVPAQFVSVGSNFSELQPGAQILLEENSGVTSAIASRPGVISVVFNSSGNFAEIIPGTGNNGGVNDTTARAHVFVDYTYFFNQAIATEVLVNLPNPGSGGVVGKVKVADNNSARPQDRIYYDFQYFASVPLAASGVDVRRSTAGIEKTFYGPFGTLSSFDIRLPTAFTLDSNVLANAPTDTSSLETGNLAMTLKFLFHDTPAFDMAGGFSFTLPTADDVGLKLTDGTSLIEIHNEAVHLIPFVAALYDPGGRIFMHAFAQIDYDFNGSPVFMNTNGVGLAQAGRVTDQTLLFLDGSLGYWLYRNSGARHIHGVATMAEVHYNKTLENAEEVAVGNLRYGDRDAELDLINGTLGVHVLAGQSIFTNAVAFPITRSDRVFDWEYRFFVNRRY
jgi:hypothetical protein